MRLRRSAYPGRQVVAFVGDGGLTMLMGELATCAKYELNVKVVVIKNNCLGQIKWEQMAFLGNPEFGCALHPSISRRWRAPAGRRLRSRIRGMRRRPREALDTPGPALIEAVVDPNEPPLPPKATFEQTKNLVEALAREHGCRPDRAQHCTRQDSRVDLNPRH